MSRPPTFPNLARNSLGLLVFSALIFAAQSQVSVDEETMLLLSPEFEDGTPMPYQFTCEGEDVNPPLAWSNVPDGTKSFVLIFDDPFWPSNAWDHWVVYNIPTDVRSIRKNAVLPWTARQGRNSWKTKKYRGPCPPTQIHTYRFTLYAIDNTLLLPSNGDAKADILKAIEGKVLNKAVLQTTYRKTGRLRAQAAPRTFRLTSPAFDDNQSIPDKYTCDGQDVSLPLQWENVPADTKSLALIFDDPFWVRRSWVHYIVYNMPPTSSGLPEGVQITEDLGIIGTNSWNRNSWSGPCPPTDVHEYKYALYALDSELNLRPGRDKKEDLEKAIDGKIIAVARLTGKYKLQRNRDGREIQIAAAKGDPPLEATEIDAQTLTAAATPQNVEIKKEVGYQGAEMPPKKKKSSGVRGGR